MSHDSCAQLALSMPPHSSTAAIALELLLLVTYMPLGEAGN